MFVQATKIWTRKKVILAIVTLAIIQLIISFKTMNNILLKEDIPKNSTSFTKNPFIEGETNWLSTNNDGKAIMIVIDSLGHYLAKDNLSYLKKVLEEEPDNSVFIKSKTDSLTVTGPRLLCMMVGTNPTLIDLIQNVEHSQETKIDNILKKMKEKKKSIYFTGDNTWLKLFPNTFTKFTDDDSFNVFDYYEQDKKNVAFVKDALKEKIKSGNEEKEVDMIIAHFLGIDHIFHSEANVEAPQVKPKYEEYNEFFKYIIENLGDRTLIICSDHGSTKKGTHGDGSKEETETFFFSYKKKGFTKNSKIAKELLKEIPTYPINIDYLNEDQQKKSPINPQGQLDGMFQLDVSVNLANMLGVSLPYPSLGMIWPIFYNYYDETDSNQEDKFKDNIANDSYTVIKQQMQLLKEGESYKDKIGDRKISEFQDEVSKIDVLYKDYKKSKKDLEKLKNLYKSVFDLNLKIKNQLSGNSSNQMKNQMLSMTGLQISIFILILFMSIRMGTDVEQIDIYSSTTSAATSQVIQSKDYTILSFAQSKGDDSRLFFFDQKIMVILILSIFLLVLSILNEYSIAQIGVYFIIICLIINILTTVRLKFIFLNYFQTRNLFIMFIIWLNHYIISLQVEFFTTHDADLFKILITSIVFYLFVYYFKGFQYLALMFLTILLSQYSINDPSTNSCPSLNNFPQGFFEFTQLKKLLNSTVLKIIIPGFICFFSVQKFIFNTFPNAGTEVYKRYKLLLKIQLAFSFTFVLINDLFPDLGNSRLIFVYLPRVQLLLFFYSQFHLFVQIPKEINISGNTGFPQIQLTRYGKILLAFLNFVALNFIYIGQKSFYVTILFFSFLYFYRMYCNKIEEKNSFLQVMILFVNTFFYFFVTDHKYGFGNLQIRAGYVGMGEYVEQYALIFILINSVTWQLYTLAIYPIFSESYESKSLTPLIFYIEEIQNETVEEKKINFSINQTKNLKKTKERLRLDYFTFLLLFVYKFTFILVVFSESLKIDNDQTHKLLPYLIGDIMFTAVGMFLVIFAYIWTGRSFEKSSRIKSI